MKKLALTFLLLFVLIFKCFSQEKKEEKFNRLIIKTDLLMPVLLMITTKEPSISVAFEKQLNDKNSIQIGTLWVANELLDIIPEYKHYYENSSEGERFFYGGYMNFRGRDGIDIVYLGVSGGHQKFFNKHFFSEFLIAGGYGKVISNYAPFANFDFRINLCLGYKF